MKNRPVPLNSPGPSSNGSGSGSSAGQAMVVPQSPMSPSINNYRKQRSGRRRQVFARATSYDDTWIPKLIPKSDDEIRSLKAALSTNILFNYLNADQLSIVMGCMVKMECKSGTVIIRQGDEGDRFYCIEKGEVGIYCLEKPEDKQPGTFVRTCVSGMTFGELSLLYNAPRSATAIATTDVLLWALDHETFNRTLHHLFAHEPQPAPLAAAASPVPSPAPSPKHMMSPGPTVNTAVANSTGSGSGSGGGSPSNTASNSKPTSPVAANSTLAASVAATQSSNLQPQPVPVMSLAAASHAAQFSSPQKNGSSEAGGRGVSTPPTRHHHSFSHGGGSTRPQLSVNVPNSTTSGSFVWTPTKDVPHSPFAPLRPSKRLSISGVPSPKITHLSSPANSGSGVFGNGAPPSFGSLNSPHSIGSTRPIPLSAVGRSHSFHVAGSGAGGGSGLSSPYAGSTGGNNTPVSSPAPGFTPTAAAGGGAAGSTVNSPAAAGGGGGSGAVPIHPPSRRTLGLAVSVANNNKTNAMISTTGMSGAGGARKPDPFLSKHENTPVDPGSSGGSGHHPMLAAHRHTPLSRSFTGQSMVPLSESPPANHGLASEPPDFDPNASDEDGDTLPLAGNDSDEDEVIHGSALGANGHPNPSAGHADSEHEDFDHKFGTLATPALTQSPTTLGRTDIPHHHSTGSASGLPAHPPTRPTKILQPRGSAAAAALLSSGAGGGGGVPTNQSGGSGMAAALAARLTAISTTSQGGSATTVAPRFANRNDATAPVSGALVAPGTTPNSAHPLASGGPLPVGSPLSPTATFEPLSMSTSPTTPNTAAASLTAAAAAAGGAGGAAPITTVPAASVLVRAVSGSGSGTGSGNGSGSNSLNTTPNAAAANTQFAFSGGAGGSGTGSGSGSGADSGVSSPSHAAGVGAGVGRAGTTTSSAAIAISAPRKA